jgi:hypothetical protein
MKLQVDEYAHPFLQVSFFLIHCLPPTLLLACNCFAVPFRNKRSRSRLVERGSDLLNPGMANNAVTCAGPLVYISGAGSWVRVSCQTGGWPISIIESQPFRRKQCPNPAARMVLLATQVPFMTRRVPKLRLQSEES